MNQPSRFAPSFRLGEWTVRPDLNRVSGPGGDVRLEPRVMAVLVRLAARPGQVVGRLELLDEVWGDAVVGEEILTRAVSELRRVFGDSARDPRYIETIIANGYRLVAVVEPLGVDAPAAEFPAAGTPAPGPAAESAAPAPPAAAPRRRSLRLGFAAIAAVAVVVAVGLALRPGVGARGPAPAPLPPAGARAVPLTSYPGHERQPAVTPDGQRIAFAWSGPEGGLEGIWIRQRNAEEPLRISEGPGLASWPAWAPGGQSVAWVQQRAGASEIRITSSIGGAARTLLAVPGMIVGLDWLPGGDGLVFAARDTVTGLHRLRLLEPTTLAVRDLGFAGPAAGDVQPRVSPDGARLAWIRLDPDGSSALWVGNLGTGESRAVLDGRTGLAGLAWSADGRDLVAGIDHAGGYGLWAVDPDGANPPRRLTEAAEFAWNPAVAAETGELVYEQVRVDQDLWRVRILGRDPWQLETGRFLSSTRWEYEAAYSPDGQRLAVVSARSGSPELWVCDADGANLQRLSDTGDAAVSRPRWSPDGARIGFHVQDWERARIAVVAAAGGPVTDLDPADYDRWLPAGDAGVRVMRVSGQAFLMFRDAESGREAMVCDLPGFAGANLAAAPDASAVIYPRLGAAEGDLMRLVNP